MSQSGFVQCSLCEGLGIWKELVTFEWIEPPIYKHVVCWHCQGKGVITQLQCSINQARGKSISVQFRGYA